MPSVRAPNTSSTTSLLEGLPPILDGMVSSPVIMPYIDTKPVIEARRRANICSAYPAGTVKGRQDGRHTMPPQLTESSPADLVVLVPG